MRMTVKINNSLNGTLSDDHAYGVPVVIIGNKKYTPEELKRIVPGYKIRPASVAKGPKGIIQKVMLDNAKEAGYETL